MSLPSNYLDAFQQIAVSGGFSQAAKILNVSQSALSQRIKNLEEELQLTLFLRTPMGVQLTEQGERLLRYCSMRDSLEGELKYELNSSSIYELAGTLRLACYSSIFRSVVLPSLQPLLIKAPHVLCEFSCAEMSELPGMLQRSEVDYIIMDYGLDQANLNQIVIGEEKFVAIEPKNQIEVPETYLDNDRSDRATELFFKNQKKSPPKYRRSYYDDCYGIIDAVKAGLGKAIMSEHLIRNDRSIKRVSKYQTFRTEVVLHHYSQPYYSKLHHDVIQALRQNSKNYL